MGWIVDHVFARRGRPRPVWSVTGRSAAGSAFLGAKLSWLVLFVALWGQGACVPDPHVVGSSKVTVGEKLGIEIEQGPELLQGDFLFTDYAGNRFDANSADVEYHFYDAKHVEFRIPAGAVPGPALVHLGTKDRPQGYDIDLEVHRMAVLVDPIGRLYVVDTATGSVVDVVPLGHGQMRASAADRVTKILATASDEAAVHFFVVTGGGLTSFSPAVDGVGTRAAGAVMLGSQVLVAVQQGLAWLEQGQAGSTLLKGFLGKAPVVSLAAADRAHTAVALLGFPGDATDFADILEVVSLQDGKPVVTAEVDLGGTAGGASWPVVAADGSQAWVNNRVDDTIAIVQLGGQPQVTNRVSLPADENFANHDPFRLVLRPDGKELLVLCAGSKSLVFYTITEGSLQAGKVIRLDNVPWDAGYVGQKLYVLTSWKVVSIDLGSNDPKPKDAGWDVGVGMSRMFIQP